MAWKDFLERIFKTTRTVGSTTITIDVPAEIYYKELALYTAGSLIANAISRSEIKTFRNHEEIKEEDYYLLNISPNRNETSSYFWHKVINDMIRKGGALVVDAGGFLYCADSWVVENERPILGDVYSGVVIGNLQMGKIFDQSNTYRFRLDNLEVDQILSGLFDDYSKLLSSAAAAFSRSNGQKYKLHLTGVKAGDSEFNEYFEKTLKKQLETYIQNDTAIYPEFDGYDLKADDGKKTTSSADFLALRKDIFTLVASALHIPESMMTGNITNIKDVIDSFLTFGVDPYADAITEGLNKRGGIENYLAGNTYQVDTSKIQHRDIFDVAASISTIIGSGVKCIDEVREMLGDAPLNTEWSKKHFITKNFDEIERFLKEIYSEGGEEE